MPFTFLFDLTLPLRHPVAIFGVLLLVVLVVPTLFQRLQLPGIVGFILAGALLGPFGANLLDRGDAGRQVPVSPINRVDVSAVSGIQRAAKELAATDLVIGWHQALSASERLFGTLQEK